MITAERIICPSGHSRALLVRYYGEAAKRRAERERVECPACRPPAAGGSEAAPQQ